MSGAVIDLSSPPRSRSGPPPAATTSRRSKRRYRLSLVPITSTFPQELLVGWARSNGPPTLRLAENVPWEEESSGQQHQQQQQQQQQQQSSPTLILGRGNTTKIKSTMLSRELLDVRLIRRPEQGTCAASSEPSILIKLLKSKKCVRLNGSLLDIAENETREVQAGDALSLYQSQFEYKFHLEKYLPDVVELLSSSDEEDDDDGGDEIIESEDAEEAATSAAGSIASGDAEADDRTAARAKKETTDTFICSICYGVLAKTQILAPCAHHVCEGCANETGMFAFLRSKKKKGGTSNSAASTNASCCPECRKRIDSILPGKTMDNLIWNGMLSGAIEFELEDIVEHLRKSGSKPTETEARNIFRSHRKYLAEHLERMREEGEAGKDGRSSDGSDGEEPPSKRSRSENELENNNDAVCVIHVD